MANSISLIVSLSVLSLLFQLTPTIIATTETTATTTNEKVKQNLRTFSVDYANNRFVKDGETFQFVSGAMHYFRVPTELWRDRLRKMKYGGLNAVETYVEWSSIERNPGEFDFSGNNNITRFIAEAQNAGLLVIVRVGPYICAERDLGGIPWWLLRNSNGEPIKLRSSDRAYLIAIDRWLDRLLPLLRPLAYEHGGPIVMFQLENEYGSYTANRRSQCDRKYTNHLRRTFERHLGPDAILFTADGNDDRYYRCGKVAPDILATINFGIFEDKRRRNVSQAFATLRRHQPAGPLMNSEFYTGWIDYWGKPHQTRSVAAIADTLDTMLSMNASVNFYMYHGGTNFGFTAGANLQPNFLPVPTSYDYDAPISESGDLTAKFFAIKRVIAKYFPVPEESVDEFVPIAEKMQLPPIAMEHRATIFDVLPRESFRFETPKSFEQLNHSSGFILYTTTIPFAVDRVNLSIPVLHDRSQIFVDNIFIGTLNRTDNVINLQISAPRNATLSILVENQGHIFYGHHINETKGILSKVYLADIELKQWTHYRIFDDWLAVIERLSDSNRLFYSSSSAAESLDTTTRKRYTAIPSFYIGEFLLPNDQDQNEIGQRYPLDSFLRTNNGWTKGIAFLNGHNLGRYWPALGPQMTLYAPSVYFKPYPEINRILMFELEQSPCSTDRSTRSLIDAHCTVQFVSHHINIDPATIKQ